MKRFRQVPAHSRMQEKKRSTLFRVMFLLFCILVVWDVAGPYGFTRLYMLHKEKARLETMNSTQKTLNSRLAMEIERIKTDPVTQEQYVRNNLQWVRDGEILYLFKTD